jgi:hypothetical protein
MVLSNRPCLPPSRFLPTHHSCSSFHLIWHYITHAFEVATLNNLRISQSYGLFQIIFFLSEPCHVTSNWNWISNTNLLWDLPAKFFVICIYSLWPALNKIQNVYCFQCTGIPKVFFMPHHIGDCRCCTTVCSSTDLSSHSQWSNNRTMVPIVVQQFPWPCRLPAS